MDKGPPKSAGGRSWRPPGLEAVEVGSLQAHAGAVTIGRVRGEEAPGTTCRKPPHRGWQDGRTQMLNSRHGTPCERYVRTATFEGGIMKLTL